MSSIYNAVYGYDRISKHFYSVTIIICISFGSKFETSPNNSIDVIDVSMLYSKRRHFSRTDREE